MRAFDFNNVSSRKRSLETEPTQTERLNLSRAIRLYKENSTLENANRVIREIASTPAFCRSNFKTAETLVNAYPADKNMVREFKTRIVPNSKVSIKEIAIDNLDNIDKKEVIDSVAQNMAIDQLISNDQALNNDGNLDHFIARSIDPTISIKACCKEVDKHNVPFHAKATIAAQEAMYLFYKNRIPVEESFVIENVLRYFSAYDFSVEDRDKMIKNLKERVMTEEFSSDDTKIKDPAMAAGLSPVKDQHLFDQTIEDCLNTSPYKMAEAMFSFFKLVENTIIVNHDSNLSIYIVDKLIPSIPDRLINCHFINDPDFRDRVKQLIAVIQNEIHSIVYHVNILGAKTPQIKKIESSKLDETVLNLLSKFKQSLEEVLDNLQQYVDYDFTTTDNNKAIHAFDKDKVNIGIHRFDIEIRPEFNRMADTADRMIDHSADHIVCLGTRVKYKLHNEASDYDLIDTDHNMDYVVAEYNIDSSSDELHRKLTEMCKTLNGTLQPRGYSCYYSLSEGFADIHMTSKYHFAMTANEAAELENHICPDDIEKISVIESVMDNMFYPFTEQDMIDTFNESSNGEDFKDFIQLCSYVGIDLDTVTRVCHEVCHNHWGNKIFAESTNSLSNYAPKADLPADVRIEAYAYLSQYIQEAKDAKALSKKIKSNTTKLANNNKSSSDNNDKKMSKADIIDRINNHKSSEKDVKDEKMGSNAAGNSDTHPIKNALVNLNLTLKGFGEKIRNLSAKEKAACKNMDAQFNQFSKAAHNTLINDRKEAIIKGQLMPSFSKSIKYAVGAAGVTGILAAIHPVLAIINIFTSIALTKHLDNKVKNDMLDEIDVELQMIDKEIQNADNRGQLKKERALLMTKKQLQRSYQRIKINAKLGRNVMPASVGTPSMYDND